jgi:hypothetical protein
MGRWVQAETNWIDARFKNGHTKGRAIAADFLKAFGTHTETSVRKYVAQRRRKVSPETARVETPLSPAEKAAYLKALRNAQRTHGRNVSSTLVFTYVPANVAGDAARLKGFITPALRRANKAPKPKPKTSWNIPKMRAVKTDPREMRKWRGAVSYYPVNDKNAPLVRNVEKLVRAPGFYLVDYVPYNLVKLGYAKSVQERLRMYVPPSDAAAKVLHLRRFKNRTANPAVPYDLPLARYEAAVKYRVQLAGVKPKYGEEWYTRANLPKIMRVIKNLDNIKNGNNWLSQFSSPPAPHGQNQGERALRNWNHQHGNLEANK